MGLGLSRLNIASTSAKVSSLICNLGAGGILSVACQPLRLPAWQAAGVLVCVASGLFLASPLSRLRDQGSYGAVWQAHPACGLQCSAATTGMRHQHGSVGFRVQASDFRV